MSDDEKRWAEADRIFDQALDLEPSAREAFLVEACGSDSELRALVERLLGRVDQDETFELPSEEVQDDALRAFALELDQQNDLKGKQIGQFRVVREIGRGGMAVVYLAERIDGEFEQQVAVKLIQSGIDTEETLRRFARERQIMARANHNHLARLLDGGTTEDGKPYFVMEYVDGMPIDRYCDETRLTVRERLALFQQVADAVAYAHRSLIVHRDIKPSNILVSADGEVKLLDFGIAGFLEPNQPNEQTIDGSRFLTPAWASPEQVRGEPVTTASDLYQLGLLLYRLLTGRSPYRVEGRTGEQLREAICSEEPTRPSTAVSRELETEPLTPRKVGEQRKVSPGVLRRELTGDLDNILLKSLRKEPERRYATVAQFSEDIEHYLSNRPVSAAPDSLAYRVRKLVSRHKGAAAFAGVALLTLVAFAVTSQLQAQRIAKERDRANLEAQQSNEVTEFLVDLFKASDPSRARGEQVTAREVLDKGAARIDEDLAGQPEVQSRLQQAIGRVYQNLGLFDEADPLLRRALTSRKERLGPDHPDVADSIDRLAWLDQQRGKFDEAEAGIRDALRVRQAHFGTRSVEAAGSMNNLGLLLNAVDRYDEAETLYREALAIYDAEQDRDKVGERSADTWSNLSQTLIHLDRMEEAEQAASTSLQFRRESMGEDHPHVAISLDTLGRINFRMDRMEQAERYLREGLAIRRKVYGDVHPQTSTSLNNLAAMLARQKDYDGAIEMFLQLLETDRELLGEDHPDFANVLLNTGMVHRWKGDTEGAKRYLKQSYETYLRAMGADHSMTAHSGGNYADLLREDGKFAEAEPLLLASYETRLKIHGPDHRRTHTSVSRLVNLYEDWGKQAQAAEWKTRRPTEEDG